MLIKTLFHKLTGIDIRFKPEHPSIPTPETIKYVFLNSGHVMEYFLLGSKGKKMAVLLYQQKVEEPDIANYLGVSVGMLRELRG